MAKVYLGMGSNIEPEMNILKALPLLAKRTHLIRASAFYRSQALGNNPAPDFINGVLQILTDISPSALKQDVLRSIERDLGRIRSHDKNAPRTLDLDILLYDDVVIAQESLVIPDPKIVEYPWIALPLLTLDEEISLPDCGKKLKELVTDKNHEESLVFLPEFTQKIQNFIKEIL